MDYSQLNAYQNSSTQRKYRYQASAGINLAFLEQRYSAFLNPHPTVQTAGRRPNEPLLAVIALYQGQTVGLIVVEKLTPEQGLVVCWHVLERHRANRVGHTLLLKMQRFASLNKLSGLSLSFREDAASQPVITKILNNLNWEKPVRDLMLYKFLPQLFIQMDWPKHIVLPKRYTMFEWCTLSEEDREYIKNQYIQTDLTPPGLSPFLPPTNFEPSTSLGLRHQDKVVGWILTHKVHTDVIEYSRLYVAPELQRLGRAMFLIVESIKRQHAIGISRSIFQVQTQNHAMIAFAEQRMQSCVTAKTGRVYSHITL